MNVNHNQSAQDPILDEVLADFRLFNPDPARHADGLPQEQSPPYRQLDEPVSRSLGSIGVSEGQPLPEPQIDIEVNGIETAHFAPARAEPYIGTAKRGPYIIRYQDDPEEGRKAAEYARTIFPGSEFSYIDGGRYGVVIADQTGKAFKVYRSAAVAYSRYEKEAGALQLLSDEGLAPKLHLFVDAHEDYRLDLKPNDYTTFGFGDVQIPRQNSGKELPVMVMDRVDVAPLKSAEPTRLIDGFCKAAEVFIRHNIHTWDAEVMVDKKTGDTIFLDVGELSQTQFDESAATADAKMKHELEIIRYLGADFGLGKSEYAIAAAYRQGGISGVQGFLRGLYKIES